MTVRGRDATLVPLQDALRATDADEAELWVHRRRAAITRYAKNEIHQNAVADETHVQARVVVGRSMGIASANSLDPADLRRLVADAKAAAQESAPNAEWPGLTPLELPREEAEPKAFDPATARADAGSQAEAIRRITTAAKERGFRAAGTHQIELSEDALANTHGVATYAPSTMAYLRALVTSDTGTGWAEDLGWSTSSLDPSGVAARAIDKAALDRDRTQLAPGDYQAVFEELAVAEVLRFMSLTGLTGQTLKDGRSFMKDRFGEQVTGANFSLWDDALDPRTLAIPFDVEGTPKRRVALVERGVAKGVVHDRQSARWFDTHSTGHAADPRRYSVGGHAGNLTMAGGDATREQLIASVKRGVLITRFHYTNTPDPKRATMTGTTRDGTFLIEDGRVTHALANVRYTMSALDLFSGIELLGPQRLARDWWSSNGMGSIVCLCPPIKVARATITGSSPI
ncbi:MAG: TldD/PmbA family protein [Candidatus Limnocylindria bacterium]